MTTVSSRTCSTSLEELNLRPTDCPLAPQDPMALSIPLIVESTGSILARQPVTVRRPVSPRRSHGWRASVPCTPSGQSAPVQLTPLCAGRTAASSGCSWTSFSVPWMRARPSGRFRCHKERRRRSAGPERTLRVEETDRAIVVHTGSATFTLDREILAPVAQVAIDDMPILDPDDTRTVLVDAQGRNCRPHVERREVEAAGPVRATLRFEGAFEGPRRKCCRFRARLSFFSGMSLVRIEFTLHNPRRARHRRGLWDLGDPGSIFFRDLSLQLGLAGSASRQIRWTEDEAGPSKITESGRLEIYQDSSGGENWRSRNHVNHRGIVPCRFRGYRVSCEGVTSFGLRASPVVVVQGWTASITAAIQEFWQQFPKAIDIDGGKLNLRLFPGQYSDLFELQGGEQKTHTALVTLWPGRSSRNRCAVMGSSTRPRSLHS